MKIPHYRQDYFMTSNPQIYQNPKLRQPQIDGYFAIYDYFSVKNKKNSAIIVLPTGVGKTGLMGLIPYHICKGRTLIITPQLTIKDAVIDSLDPENPESFWYKRDIFQNTTELPTLIEYNSSTGIEIMESANIVILNIQKLQGRLESSPLNFLPEDFFDMVIIDEAHHSVANTWIETTQHFNKAKVVKLTATPIRADGRPMSGDLVYKYKLSQAMAKGYVKSLKNFEYIPEELRLTIDEDLSKEYSIGELLALNIRDEDWINRSVAYSEECSISVVEESIKKLEEKKKHSNVPHKIIAVACSIMHAKQIEKLYINRGYKAETIHSKLEPNDRERIMSDIDNHRIDVIINVAMLGEGYDHPYLSVAAIFRPFKNELPYQQFIGRVLRTIPSDEVQVASDNIAEIVSHKHLGLADLWNKYKVEIEESDIIKKLTLIDLMDDDIDSINENHEERKIEIGKVSQIGDGVIKEDVYLTTELIKKNREEEIKRKKSIEELQKLLNIEYDLALSIYNQSMTQQNVEIKRPDLYFSRQKKNIDNEIREIIVPEIIAKFHIDQESKSLEQSNLFIGKYNWIISKAKNNAAMLAMYLNTYLKWEIGKARSDWKLMDYDMAFSKLEIIQEYIEKIISDELKK